MMPATFGRKGKTMRSSSNNLIIKALILVLVAVLVCVIGIGMLKTNQKEENTEQWEKQETEMFHEESTEDVTEVSTEDAPIELPFVPVT